MTMKIVETSRPAKRYGAAQRITRVELSPDGTVTQTILSERKGKRRVSKQYRGMDKLLRRMSKAQGAAADEYLKRHERSNDKKKNGAIKKLPKNMMKAQKKGLKKMKISIF